MRESGGAAGAWGSEDEDEGAGDEAFARRRSEISGARMLGIEGWVMAVLLCVCVQFGVLSELGTRVGTKVGRWEAGGEERWMAGEGGAPGGGALLLAGAAWTVMTCRPKAEGRLGTVLNGGYSPSGTGRFRAFCAVLFAAFPRQLATWNRQQPLMISNDNSTCS